MKGWYGDKYNHSLASKGIKTSFCNVTIDEDKFMNNVLNEIGYDTVEELKDNMPFRYKFFDVDDIEEHMKVTIEEFDEIYKKDKIILNRVVWTEKLDIENLGYHYFRKPLNFLIIEDLYLDRFKGKYELEDGMLIKVEIPTKDIDFKESLSRNLIYVGEYEIILNTDDNVKLLNVQKLSEVMDNVNLYNKKYGDFK